MAENKKNKSGSRRTRAARLLCLFLVVLMVLGCASTAIIFLIVTRTSAASYTEPVMSIGIQYGDTAAGSFRTYSDTGYTIWSQMPDGNRTATKVGTLSDKTLIVAPHANLAVSGTGYAVSSSNIAIGGYRLDVATEYSTYTAAADAANKISYAAAAKGYQVFPACVNGKFRVRIGCFASQSAAESAKSAAASIAGTSVTVSAPSSGAVSVINTSGQIKFEYENGTTTYLSLSPAGSGDVYMRADNSYIYEGSFMYKRSGNLLTVINMIGLETYVEGVLPYEISSSWHVEAQKAFAIAARSYAMGNRGKHYSAYGFDLCCTTNCQVYRGAGSVNDTVKNAVAATAGEILIWNGKVATLYYSSSTGGCTVSAENCWGGTGSSYLEAVSTPWERYASYNNGLWTAEVSPTDLCEYLSGKGYTTLTGSIADISVTEYAKNSSYVKSLKITDTSGNSITLTNTDKIRTTLSSYLKSANFVVGRGSVAYTVSEVTASTEVLPYNYLDMSSFNIITSIGQILTGLSEGIKVASGSGRYDVNAGGYVITADNADGSGDEVAAGYKTTYTTKTATASDSGNFVFVGKGWGHGVGLSQYGTKDLAEFGYTYERILEAYVPAAEIGSVSDLG